MTEKNLQYFFEAARQLNFSEAAKRLHITQPTLSRLIVNLEEELGFDLFFRSTKGVSLTPGGKFFLDRSRMISDSFRIVVGEARELNEEQKIPLSLGFQIGHNLDGDIVSRIKRIQKKNTRLAIDLHCMYHRELLDYLRIGGLDIAFSNYFDEDYGGLKYREIGVSPLYIVVSASHPFARAPKPDFKLLSDYPLVAVADSINPNGESFLLRCCERCGIKPAKVIKATSYLEITLRLMLDMGFYIINSRPWYNSQELRTFALPADINIKNIVIWKKAARNPTAQKFLRVLFED